MSAAWQKKGWSEILNEYSSGEDSDEYDSLNVCSVYKNAGRVTDLLHATMPTLDPSRAKSVPMGMNNVNVIREGLVDAMLARSHHLREFREASFSASDAGEKKKEMSVTSNAVDAPSPSSSTLEEKKDPVDVRSDAMRKDSECQSEEGHEEGVVV